MNNQKYTIRTRFWIDLNQKPFIGLGRVKLLEEINKSGSITAAAKSLNMSYRQAWEHIKNMNEIASEPLVIAVSGGKNGGGTQLTPVGKKYIKQYKSLHKKLIQFTEEYKIE